MAHSVGDSKSNFVMPRNVLSYTNVQNVDLQAMESRSAKKGKGVAELRLRQS